MGLHTPAWRSRRYLTVLAIYCIHGNGVAALQEHEAHTISANGHISNLEHRYPAVMRSSPWPPTESVAMRPDSEDEEHYSSSLAEEHEVQAPAANGLAAGVI